MTDITNTKITRKTESYGNDYKAMKTEAMILQKKGAPFMMASVVIWTLVTITRMLPVDIMTKNLYTFYCPSMLIPCVLIFSKIIGAHVFKNSISFRSHGSMTARHILSCRLLRHSVLCLSRSSQERYM